MMPLLTDPSLMNLSMFEWLLLITLAVLIPTQSWLTQRNFRVLPAESASRWRREQYRQTMTLLWTTCALSLWIWWAQGGSAVAAGLVHGGSQWQLLGGWAFALAASAVILRSGRNMSAEEARAVLDTLEHDPLLKQFTPHTNEERSRWLRVSLTAGITEEVIYRGVVLAMLIPHLGTAAAATISLVLFSLGHLYQGPKSVARVLAVGGILTALVLVSGSIWPAVLLHAAIDLSSGFTLIRARQMLSGGGRGGDLADDLLVRTNG